MNFVDISKTILQITSAVVLLGIPAKFMGVWALWGLGAISKAYRRAAQQTFSIADECGAVAVSLMTQSVPFLDLADVDDCITLERMVERLGSVLRHRASIMDADEVKRLAAFCFKQVAQKSCRVLTDEHKSTEDRIDIDAFSVAMSSSAPICFDEVAHLFDRDRKKTCLEKFFTPPSLLHFMYDQDVKVETGVTATLESQRTKHLEAAMQLHEMEHTQSVRSIEDKQLSLEAKLTKRLNDLTQLLHDEQQKVKRLREQIALVQSELQLVQPENRPRSRGVTVTPSDSLVAGTPSGLVKNAEAASDAIQTLATVTATAAQNLPATVNVLERESSKTEQFGELSFLFQQLGDRLSHTEKKAREARERMMRAEMRATKAEAAVQSLVRHIS